MKIPNVMQAAERVYGRVRITDVALCASLDALAGDRILFLKCENLQKTGSFKARGALNAVLALDKKRAAAGVVCHSAGNHGQALAWAAAESGLPCTVVVPQGTPKVKCDAIVGYGAELIFSEPTTAARVALMNQIAEERGMTPVPPYDDTNVIAGQGTMAFELLSQAAELQDIDLGEQDAQQPLDAIIVPISGGGMAAGVALATKELSPFTKVILVEPAGKDLQRSMEAEERLWAPGLPPLPTIADGMRTPPVGEVTWPFVAGLCENEVLSVTDDEIRAAMRLTLERVKMVVEPSGATALAAALQLANTPDHPLERDGKLERIGVILCGGNLDFDQYEQWWVR